MHNMSNIMKSIQGAGFLYAKGVQSCIAAMLAMSVAWDDGLQITGGVVTAALIAILIAEYWDDGIRWHRFVVFAAAVVIVGVILIVLGALFYPLGGSLAVFMHWHAIIVCLAVLSIIGVNLAAKPEDREEDTTWIVLVALATDMLIVLVLWILKVR